jgi:hypothetical protein
METQGRPSEAEAVEEASPMTLTRLRGGTHYMWSEAQKAQFRSWWEATPYGRDHKDVKTKGDPNWESDDRSSPIWAAYDQCARVSTGEPALHCKTCHKLFAHPNKNHSGTSSLNAHMKACEAHHGIKRPGQQLVSNMLSKVL